MGDDRRWAARYQFLAEVWRGRDRIVCDRELEAALHAGAEGPIAELLTSLVPGEDGGERAWVALHNDRRAASFARERSGTVFVALDEAAEIASDEGWQVALVHLAGERGEARTRAELLAGVESFLEVLGERLEDDAERSVVLSLPTGPDEDGSYELLAELVEELFGDGRIYGLTRPGMAAFYEFGPVIAAAGSDDDEADADAPEVGIEVDNSLGSETPRFDLFIAVVGATLPGEGVTFVELPSGEAGPAPRGGSAPAGDDELAAVRVQLSEAQRRGDLQAIERQSLLEKLEQAEDRIASLEEQLDEASGAGGAEAPAASAAEGARIDELLAREQTLRWEVERLRGEIERLEARPVEELEAELAGLRAELDRTRTQLELAEAELEAGERDAGHDEDPDEDLDEDELAEEAGELTLLLDGDDEPSPAQLREWRRARSKLDHLLRKLERGGRLSALELHRELSGLKRLLQ